MFGTKVYNHGWDDCGINLLMNEEWILMAGQWMKGEWTNRSSCESSITVQNWVTLSYPRIRKRISQPDSVKDNPSDYQLNTAVITNQPVVKNQSRSKINQQSREFPNPHDSQNLGHRWGQAYNSPNQSYDHNINQTVTDVDMRTTLTNST